jgi:hypothetical protein
METWRLIIMEPLRLTEKLWKVSRPVIADLHHSMRSRIPIRLEGKVRSGSASK